VAVAAVDGLAAVVELVVTDPQYQAKVLVEVHQQNQYSHCQQVQVIR